MGFYLVKYDYTAKKCVARDSSEGPCTMLFEPLLITSMLIRGRKLEVEEFLNDLSKKLLAAKAGLLSEIKSEGTEDQLKTTKFVKKRSVLIRQVTAKSETEAKGFNLSNKDGIKNTEDMFLKRKRLEAWLTL